MRIQMLGLCRFSYLGGRGFQTAPDSLEERRAYLYDPQRLARRWFWFEHVTLPSLLVQTDPDFTLVLMTGPDLPDPWLSNLRELAGTVPQFRLALIPPMESHLDACMAAVAPHIEPGADVVGHFRQDDDDAVAVDYIRHARRDFADMRQLWERKRRLFCDYTRGVVLRVKPKGITTELRITHHASAALTVYLPPDAERCVVHYPHWQVGALMPGVALASRPMYVRLLHHDNDSGAVGPGYRTPVQPESFEPVLAERFRIDLAALRDGTERLLAG
ncbi:hypothetical protein F8A10_09085 [Paracoccus kondratievae]|uniref:DNA-directed RNA polymerase subunit beta n=1 Tax=Paracoccus kondratievae TaxID=135740 RepID=A0AAD3P0J9_9RHOB|nr:MULTISPECIES: putative rhamnosyl transferase [Paracoccus]QFQ87571.1 hypothetical protein F8A10_09085 [Paracoccus kondratievae]GLK65377.1 DNA-directed RNA polymerase subunit beta' [Paracoccus kondratievae]SMG53584.1 Putative rhamnosyl transferase [Paracoccus sp. J56]